MSDGCKGETGPLDVLAEPLVFVTRNDFELPDRPLAVGHALEETRQRRHADVQVVVFRRSSQRLELSPGCLRDRDGMEAVTTRPGRDRSREKRVGTFGELGVIGVRAQDDAGSGKRARPCPARDERAQRGTPTVFEDWRKRPCDRHVLADRVVARRVEIAEARGELGCAFAPLVAAGDGAHRTESLVAEQELRIDTRGFEKNVEVARVLRFARSTKRASSHPRARVEHRCASSFCVFLAMQCPRADRAPAIVGVVQIVARRCFAELFVLEECERGFCAGTVVDFHPGFERIVEVARAGAGLVESRECRSFVFRRFELARCDGARNRGRLVVAERSAFVLARDLVSEPCAIAFFGRTHRGVCATREHERRDDGASGFHEVGSLMRSVVIVNRRARHLERAGPLLEALTAGSPLASVQTGSLEELDAAARAIAADPPDTVVLAGGDGSYMAGITSLFHAFRAEGDAPPGRAFPKIALAPGGTVSTVARNWGYRGNPARYVSRLLNALAKNDAVVTERPTLRVCDETNDRVGFIFGAGLVSRFFEVYEAEGARGNFGAARIVGRIFGGSFIGGALAKRVLSPVPCEIRVEDRVSSLSRVSLLCASVVPNVGLGLRLLYRAAEAQDRFHVVASALGPLALGPQMPRVLLGRPLLGDGIDTLAKSLAIRLEAGDAYVLDGELTRSSSVAVTAGPVLRVVGL